MKTFTNSGGAVITSPLYWRYAMKYTFVYVCCCPVVVELKGYMCELVRVSVRPLSVTYSKFLQLFGKITCNIDRKISGWTQYGIPRIFLTFSHALLNFHHFPLICRAVSTNFRTSTDCIGFRFCGAWPDELFAHARLKIQPFPRLWFFE